MKMRFQMLSAAALALAFLLPLQAAADEGPVPELRKAVDEVVAILFPGGVATDPVGAMPKVREVIDRHFNFDVIARRSLGRGWDRLTEEQRGRFSSLFAELLMSSYADRLTGLSQPDIEWGGSRELGSRRLEVDSSIIYKGSRYEVIYRLVDMNGSWEIYDLVIEGVSLVGNYRSQFTSVLDRRGPDELLSVLQQRVTSQQENTSAQE